MNTINLFFKRWRSAHNGPRPSRDWRLLLVATFLLLVAVTGWSLWVFQTIITGGTVGVTTSLSTKPERRVNPVDTVRSIYSARATEEANYSTGVYRYADPSQ
jgi:hypothetical protein